MFLIYLFFFFFFKQKTAYEMRISDWSSDVCSSDLRPRQGVDQFDRGWNHIGRHLRANEILEVLLARLRPLDDLDHRDRDLAEPAVPDRKDARLAHRVVQTPIGRASCRERVCQYV